MARYNPMGLVRYKTYARPVIFLSLLLLVIIPTGCTKRNFAELRPGLETRGHYIDKVPFYRQSESTCGPAALAGIFAYWGHSESLQSITAAIYLPNLGGTLPMDMENFARKAGFETISSSGTMAELKIAIRKGIPVVCMLDLGFSLYHRPHYITVIGYDDVHAVIICHDGSTPNSLVDYDKFNREWARAGRWMLKIEPKTDETRHAP